MPQGQPRVKAVGPRVLGPVPGQGLWPPRAAASGPLLRSASLLSSPGAHVGVLAARCPSAFGISCREAHTAHVDFTQRPLNTRAWRWLPWAPPGGWAGPHAHRWPGRVAGDGHSNVMDDQENKGHHPGEQDGRPGAAPPADSGAASGPKRPPLTHCPDGSPLASTQDPAPGCHEAERHLRGRELRVWTHVETGQTGQRWEWEGTQPGEELRVASGKGTPESQLPRSVAQGETRAAAENPGLRGAHSGDSTGDCPCASREAQGPTHALDWDP